MNARPIGSPPGRNHNGFRFKDVAISGWLATRTDEGLRPLAVGLIGTKVRILGKNGREGKDVSSYDELSMLGTISRNATCFGKENTPIEGFNAYNYQILLPFEGEKQVRSRQILDARGHSTGFFEVVIRHVDADPTRVSLAESGEFYITGATAELAKRKFVTFLNRTTVCPPEWVDILWNDLVAQGAIESLEGFNMSGFKIDYNLDVVRQAVSKILTSGRGTGAIMDRVQALAAGRTNP